MFSVIATLIVFLLTLLFAYNWQKHSYWKSRGVPTPTSYPLIGHFHIFLGAKAWTKNDKFYKKFQSKGFWGMYELMSPRLMISDLDYIREILVKHSDHFIDRRKMNFAGQEEIFNEMLTNIGGEKWKALRSLVSPTFTSGKIRGMFSLIDQKANDLINECEKEMCENSFVEIKSCSTNYTMDVIGTCAFGIDTNCIQQREGSAFIKNLKEMSKFRKANVVKFLIMTLCPKLYTALGIRFNNGESISFFVNAVKKTIALRRKSGVRRGDFLDLMLEALDNSEKDGDNFKYPMTMDTVIAQSILFLFSGLDTTSNTMAFMTYLLAKNPEKQERLRSELQKIVDVDGELNYQNLMEAHYLDACLSETLRIYPPAHTLERSCTKRFTLPGTAFEIPEDMLVAIPAWSLHMDPEFWEEPTSFLPDRFLPENKANIKTYTYLPFGLGPRNCVGMRFAQFEAKLAIARLSLNFEIGLRPGFTEVTLETMPGVMKPDKTGILLALKKITKSIPA